MESDLKKTGYSLLALGLLMIIGSVLQVILVFTGTIEPIQLFSFRASDFALDGSTLFPQLPSNLTNDVKVELFPADLINTTFNLILNTVLAGIIIFAGSKISTIGTQLLRPVYVKMRTNEKE